MKSSIIRSAAAAMNVLEAAHSEAGSLARWAERTAEAGQTLLHLPFVTCSVTVREEDRYRELARAGSGVTFFPDSEKVPLPVMDCLFRMAQVARPIDLVAKVAEPSQSQMRAFIRESGMLGGGGVMGYVGRTCFALFSFDREPTVISAKDRALLRQVAAHIEAGLALRVGEAKQVAVLRPDGRVDHAEGLARESDSRDRLTAHVREVESARTRSRRRAPTALETWTALVNGHWGLIERLDRDGKRFYVILESPPRTSRFRALTPNEARVLELSARGVSGKSAAYALGVSAAAISQTLSSAALKLGCKSRTELVYMASLLLGPKRDPRAESKLTVAESKVLALVRAGFSNAEIAVKRGTSERTVSNQVARLLKKTNTPSRRVLAAWPRTR